jgi:hypothetical protein
MMTRHQHRVYEAFPLAVFSVRSAHAFTPRKAVAKTSYYCRTVLFLEGTASSCGPDLVVGLEDLITLSKEHQRLCIISENRKPGSNHTSVSPEWTT